MLICKSCEHEFIGKFCNNCGEKVVNGNDFSIRSIVAQAVGIITNFDSKFFQTIKLLFFYPGELTKKYVEGIRMPYMKPFQLFVISNVLFFIFLADIDIFRIPSKWFFSDQYSGVAVNDIVDAIAAELNLSRADIASK